jgi:hypothetical protein
MGKLSAYQPRLQPREAQICIWDVTRSRNKVKLDAKTKQKNPQQTTHLCMVIGELELERWSYLPNPDHGSTEPRFILLPNSVVKLLSSEPPSCRSSSSLE